jgi:hypothetical protein
MQREEMKVSGCDLCGREKTPGFHEKPGVFSFPPQNRVNFVSGYCGVGERRNPRSSVTIDIHKV